jgi:hypothetical protein
MLTDEQAKHYLFEIAQESELVERLHARFQNAADRWLQAHHQEARDGRVAWTSLESEREMQETLEGILSAYARVSLFVFPAGTAGERGRARAARLRELLEITADHRIGNRNLRNHWMHLDERLDEALETTGEVPVGYQLALANSLSDAQKKLTFRLIDPSEESIYVFGEVFHIGTLANAVRHIGQQAALALVDKFRPHHGS